MIGDKEKNRHCWREKEIEELKEKVIGEALMHTHTHTHTHTGDYKVTTRIQSQQMDCERRIC